MPKSQSINNRALVVTILLLVAVASGVYFYSVVNKQQAISDIPIPNDATEEYVFEDDIEKPDSIADAQDVIERSELFIFEDTFTVLYSDSERSLIKVHANENPYDSVTSRLIIEEDINAADLSSDEKYIAYSTNKSSKEKRAGVYLADVEQTEVVLIKEAIEGVRFSETTISPNNAFVAFVETVGETDSLVLHNVKTKAVQRISSSDKITAIHSYAWTENGKLLVLASIEGQERKQVLFSESATNFNTLQPLAEDVFSEFNDLYAVLKSPQSTFFIASGKKTIEEEDKNVVVLLKPAPDPQQIQLEIPDNAQAENIVWDNDGKKAYIGNQSNTWMLNIEDENPILIEEEKFRGRGELDVVNDNIAIFTKRFSASNEEVEQVSIIDTQNNIELKSDIFSKAFLLVLK